MKHAHVYFTKEVEKDNWNHGVTGERNLIHEESFVIGFEDTEHLIEQLADYMTKYYDVFHNDFIEYVTNEIENNRFDYQQNEDNDSNKIDLTEERPNGYLCDYTFHITKVTQEIEYKF